MNIEIINQNKTNHTYPYIGICNADKAIVLFTSPNTGTCITNKCNNHFLGRHLNYWTEYNFVVCSDKLIFQN